MISFLQGYRHSLQEKYPFVHDRRRATPTRWRFISTALRNGSGIQSTISIKVDNTCELKMSAEIGMSDVDWIVVQLVR